MPFKSKKQRKFLHANEPEIARKWEDEAKRTGEPAVQPKKKTKKGGKKT